MRVANNTMTYNFLNSMNRSLSRMNDLQEKLSDGRAIHRPSDDPIKAIRSLRFNSNLTMNEQFTQNVRDGISWMQTTDGAMSNLSSIVIRAKELVTRAVTPNPGIAYETLGEEIDGLIDQAVNLSNTQLGERFIFSGQKDKTQAVTRFGDTFAFNGDNQKISMPIQPGAANPEQDSVNITAQEMFGSNMELLNHLVEIKNQLKNSNPDMTFLSTTAMINIDADHDRVLNSQTQLGTRMAMYELSETMLDTANIDIETNLGKNEDLDIPKAMIDFKNNENVYRMALSVGAKIMPPSLIDFLR